MEQYRNIGRTSRWSGRWVVSQVEITRIGDRIRCLDVWEVQFPERGCVTGYCCGEASVAVGHKNCSGGDAANSSATDPHNPSGQLSSLVPLSAPISTVPFARRQPRKLTMIICPIVAGSSVTASLPALRLDGDMSPKIEASHAFRLKQA